MAEVDIRQLAIDRQETTSSLSVRRNWLSRYVIPGTIVLGFLGLVAWAAWDFLIPPRKVRVIPVVTSIAETRSEGTPLFNAAGWIEPRPTSIRVAALASGVVEKLLVVEDQEVSAGEPVAELVKEDAELAYQAAVANRELAEAELEKAAASLVAAKTRHQQPVHLEAEVARAQASLAKVGTMLKNLKYETERAESKLELAERNHQRNLQAGDSVSQFEIDTTESALETAKATVEELKERETSLKAEERALTSQVRATTTQLQLLADEIQAKDEAVAIVNAAKAKVAQQRVKEAEAKLRLSRMTIRAPVAGRIYQLIGLPGARVGEGIMTAMKSHDGSSVVTMYQPAKLQIRVDVRFEDIPKVSLNQTVKINNPALTEPIEGKVLFISSEADIQKNTLQVKVSIEVPPSFFKPEMLVDVTFLAPPTKPSDEVSQATKIFVARKFLFSSEDGDFVWVADRSEKRARKVFVTKGRPSGPLVEIVKGLSIDARVISTGHENLRHGDRISIQGEDVYNN